MGRVNKFLQFILNRKKLSSDILFDKLSDILTKESLHEVLTEGCENVPVQGWRPVWALRYSVLVKCRGIIKNKGYVVKNSFFSNYLFLFCACCKTLWLSFGRINQRLF